ncbi:cytochrome c biogenesis protein CcdA [Gemella sp. GH3]|uniref:cytochrome c biogenesis CcdA family protein n=1 Tax=unclassified Gemella TaxID=2624949 RepID=UPI0015D064D7|nr:cytochrome c biogenesis protein CcdA [Gemella sp. GH3.1]NYS50621.1 cytochrome c biogenesis protein CcdA [Gemella sp. GH3]
MDFQNIKLLAVFIEGVLSFFSPCVIPIIPIYLSILAGKREKTNDGKTELNGKTTIINSTLFIIGISTTFFILAFATSFISSILQQHITTVKYISGIIIIFMGLLQLGVINLQFFKREFSLKRKFKVQRKIQGANPALSFIMGFTFSFSWTPCIGPILASVFLYASTHTGILSYLLIIIYCLGFILPFIIVAIFASSILKILKKHNKILDYTIIISGIILVIIGISILTGSFQGFIAKYIF